jgi:hypothetical protein
MGRLLPHTFNVCFLNLKLCPLFSQQCSFSIGLELFHQGTAVIGNSFLHSELKEES